MANHESSSAQSNHQMHAVNALREIYDIARYQYAADQNNAAWVEVIKIAQKAIAENE